MNLSFSNIAWTADQDDEMYVFLQEHGFDGLEIAPMRIFPEEPYERIDEAWKWSHMLLKNKYGLNISSMQSIWYGRSERIFGTDNERKALIDYTAKAIDFAVAVDCSNLVFGCPKNRNIPAGLGRAKTDDVAQTFFSEIGGLAQTNGLVIALEPNPTIYGTNFINCTAKAFDFARNINGLMVNIDCGTLIENQEDLSIIADNIAFVNHVHISEPNLVKIQKRNLHKELSLILKSGGYDKYVSVEMRNFGDLDLIKQTAEYIRRIFT